MRDLFDAYFKALKRTPVDEKTEHTDRGALETLLQAFATKQNKHNQIVHEPGRQGDKGAPDYKVRQSGQIVGYVENKKIDDDLNRVAKGEQIARYTKLSNNILLTDYLQFIWIKDGKIEKRAGLAYSSDLLGKGSPSDARIAEVSELLNAFFSTPPVGIGRAQNLAVELAKRCRLLRDDLVGALVKQQRAGSGGRLMGLYQVFKNQVFHDLELQEFADAFAQTLGYGLFLAKYNVPANEVITLNNAQQYVPQSFALIRELVDFLKDLDQPAYAEIKWVVEEIVSLVNGLDLAALHQDLSFSNRKLRRGTRAHNEEEARLFERDPYIYFYEDFLKAYDASTRESRGVYYTPPPVVNFIVRAVDDILVRSFDIKDGLADHKQVTVLDFACGTGTFLLEVFERILTRVGSSKGDMVLREHLLKNIFGFEYLIAPYTIAHLKLSQYLKDKGHPIPDGERLKVFLTNTLEPIAPQQNMLLPELTAETRSAQEVKDKDILVITGNPPYSGHSLNMGAAAVASVRAYTREFPDLQKPGQGKWLQDDYVKFIRFAQTKMDAVDEGVVAVITNHAFLDNPTFKGMRKSLLESFDQIFLLDLHGNSKKKETAPDGSEDKNVFDIQQGVAISLFIKNRRLPKGVFHSNLWGPRQAKYQSLADQSVSDLQWQELEPLAPFYFLIPFEGALWSEYEKFPAIPAIFAPGGDPAPGIVTTQDEFAISWTPEEAVEKVDALLATSSEAEARKLFRLCSQNQWSYETAKAELPGSGYENKVVSVAYRPFDTRYSVWDRHVAVHRRERVMGQMLKGNIALVTSRLTKGELFKHVQAVDKVTEVICMSPKTSNNGFVFPLYIYAPAASAEARRSDLFGGSDRFQGNERMENLAPKFRQFIDLKYGYHFSPEEVMGYIYAVLHAPAYRNTYAEFLRIDFPRIPFCDKRSDFEALSALGWDLMQKHLLRDVPKLGLGAWSGKGDNVVEKPIHVPDQRRLMVNKHQFFDNVPPDVFAFHIGGYQVLAKYLKDRKGRTLTLDEINNVENVVNVLAFTIEQMQKIDEAYAAAFPQASG